jgi:hypothetical protein
MIWPLRPPAPGRNNICDSTKEPPHIVVDAIVSLCVPYLPEVPEYREYELMEFVPDIPMGAWQLTRNLKIPLIVVEYVKSQDAAKSARHLPEHAAHLFMSMSTATAFCTFLRIRVPIYGLLVDGTRVSIYAGWESATSSSSVSPVSFAETCQLQYLDRHRDRNPHRRMGCHTSTWCGWICLIPWMYSTSISSCHT